MKTLLTGIAIGVALKYFLDSKYGEEMKETVNDWWDEMVGNLEDKIHTATGAVEKAAGKVDDAMTR